MKSLPAVSAEQEPLKTFDCFAGNGEMAALMRATDWAKTAVGPVEAWPQSLKLVVRLMLTSRYAMWMGWGPGSTFFYNDAYRPTLGVKHPWALGASAQEVWEEIWPEIGPRIETVLQTGNATWDEALMLFLERSGYTEETYHTFSYSPLADDCGDIGGMLCVVTEETERVIGQRRLTLLREVASALASTQTYEEVFAAVRNCLEAGQRDLPFTLTYLFDAEGRCARLECTTGIPPGHPVAAPRVDIAGKNTPWPFQSALAQASPLVVEDLSAYFRDLPTGPWKTPPQEALIVPLAHQGQERPAGFLVAAISPYRRLDADYIGFVGLLAGQIAASLASARAYEDERKRAEALAELDRAKTTFFSNVSHEFRTPLTLMLGPMEDALRTDTRALVAENLDVVHRNGLRLLKLVNTLLDFSRIEAGRVQASYEPIDLAAYTNELASVFRSAMEKAGLRFMVNCPPLSSPIYVDREMWEKIVLNLVSNAFKFTEAGEVEVALQERDGVAELSVRDTGSGIAQEQLPHIFERFHRVEGVQARTQEGTGIGLALVQELVRLHGGEIRVESEYGRGSTFIVSLPLGVAHLPKDRLRTPRTLVSTALGASPYVEEALRWLPEGDVAVVEGIAFASEHVASEVVPVEEGVPKKRILLADDNADMRAYVSQLLRGDYHVTTVGDGSAALAAVQESRPDLILCDVMMPGLNGFELLRTLRNDARTRTIPIILLSARAGEEARVEGLEAGADDYLTKPFSAKELLARVATHLQLAQVRKEAEEAIRGSQERLRAALDASETGTFRWDIPTDALEWDPNLERLLGLAPGGAVHSLSHLITRVHPQDQAEFIARCRRCVEEGADFEMEFRVIWPDGTVHWLYERGKTLQDEAGHPASMTGACVDITARKQEELAREFLTEASSLLASSLEYEQTLQQVADLAVPHIADWCVVDILEEGGTIRQLAVAHVNPDKVKLAYELRRLYPLMPDEPGISEVLRTGKPILYPEIPEELLLKAAQDARHREMLRHIGLYSVMIVPMVARERILGAITFIASQQSGQIYGPEDLKLAQGLAERAALAIDNTLLYRAAQQELEERKKALEALALHQTEIEALNGRLRRAMRETHHRVKNNLQVITSLVNLQQMQHAEQIPAGELQRLNQHIAALASIHDLLTQQAQDDAEVSDVSVREIMNKLMPTMQGMVHGRKIAFDVEELRLPARLSTTFAVLVNELVSNALKHGRGDMQVRLKVSETSASLIVMDQGPGFP
ncbi:MAG TPA: ATP-binding protein, partial [Chthonomonadaceae bacterium]|nr:ATP-binding protein [Chthonomonadaceae bacterium]